MKYKYTFSACIGYIASEKKKRKISIRGKQNHGFASVLPIFIWNPVSKTILLSYAIKKIHALLFIKKRRNA